MKIAFVRPAIGPLAAGFDLDGSQMEPLGPMVLAALTPPDVEVVLRDDRFDPVTSPLAVDLVAITVETFTAARAYSIADLHRAAGVRVVLGGLHPTLAPLEARAHADALVLGDAEPVWRRVVADARRGQLERCYDARALRATPSAARRDLCRGLPYLPLSLIQLGRGCRNACAYCAPSVFFGRQHHHRSVAQVVCEIEHHDLSTLFFVDDNIAADLTLLRALCVALRPVGVRWVSQASLDIAEHPGLLDAMVASGCIGQVIGFETLRPQALRAMGKVHNLRGWDGYRRAVCRLRQAGLQTWAAFTLGHDGDTEASIAEMVDFALDSGFAMAAFNLLMPYPGTALYRTLAQQGRLLYDGQWWSHPDYRYGRAAFVPGSLTADALSVACRRADERFYRTSSIARRALDRSNRGSVERLLLFGIYNLLYRRSLQRSGDAFADLDALRASGAPPSR
ncbi:MAG: B12-binding domain-containing radical SAM protein [Pseudomonadota bacterium]